MAYFSEHYGQLSDAILTATGELYFAQIGAIHDRASHFTVCELPALVTMPTGSGKTAVLKMAPFVLRSTRVLVTTSGMVREQIAKDFARRASMGGLGAAGGVHLRAEAFNVFDAVHFNFPVTTFSSGAFGHFVRNATAPRIIQLSAGVFF